MQVNTIIGRLTKEPELRYTSENKPITNINVAINNNKDDVTFLQVTYFGKLAETIHKYCHKGDLISSKIMIRNHNWTDKDNNKHYDYSFIGDNINFLSSKSNSTNEEKTSENEPKNELEQEYADFNDIVVSDDEIAF